MPDAPHDPVPLEKVVDDYAPRQEAIEWATDELTGGRGFEEVHQSLVENGWSDADATAIVEEARRRTRHVRGVVTRDDVMRDANRRYRQAMGVGWFAAFPSVAAIRRLVHALGSLAFLRRQRRREAEVDERGHDAGQSS